MQNLTSRAYYIDPQAGNDAQAGRSPEQPLKNYAQLALAGGDTVLFKRGSVIRDALHTRNGSSEAGAITYGAYGEGAKPVFLGSLPADGAANWVEEQPSVWRFTGTFPSEVCNLVFNHGEACGNLRWRLADLKQPGEWYYSLIGRTAATEKPEAGAGGVLYLWSARNPGLTYASIECALWGERRQAGGQSWITLDNLAFRNGGVHGYQDCRVEHITIRNCEFHCIGGAVWSLERKIRFGNAVELWDGARDVRVEGCVFTKIYDSGVTHQGGDQSDTPDRLWFCGNLFVDCGMAAYECRGPAAREVYFDYNTCINAGGEFTMQGEPPPRQSELYPEPMGHHIFIWRIDPGTQVTTGKIYIRHNIFCEAPDGMAIYSVIDPADERQFVIEDNCYWQPAGSWLMRMNGRVYTPAEFDRYQADTGHDLRSVLAAPRFINRAAGDYRLQSGSPGGAAGLTALP